MRSRAVLLPVLLVLLPACERGCLSTWLSEHGVGRRPPPTSRGSLPLNAVDCPDGLARCLGGVVEASRVSRFEVPCNGPPEACHCPWEAVGECPHGCAAEGAEIVVSKERAMNQLCAWDPSVPVARAAEGPPPPGVCEAPGYRCVASVVVACVEVDAGIVSRAVAVCLRGCATDGDVLDEDEAVPESSAIRILCAR